MTSPRGTRLNLVWEEIVTSLTGIKELVALIRRAASACPDGHMGASWKSGSTPRFTTSMSTCSPEG